MKNIKNYNHCEHSCKTIIKNILEWDQKLPFNDFEYHKTIGWLNNELSKRFKLKGLSFLSIDNMVNPTKAEEQQVVHIIDDFLELICLPECHPRSLDMVVRIFANKMVAKKRNMFNFFKDIYINIPPTERIKNNDLWGVDQAFANVIAVHCTSPFVYELKNLIINENLGSSRILLLHSYRKLNKNNHSETIAFFKELRHNEIFAQTINALLKREIV